MLICPKCGSAYREGFTKCSDCDIDLINEKDSFNKKEPKKIEWSFLINVLEEHEIANIKSMLEENEIPVITKIRGIGEYLKIRMGKTYHGVDLFVPKERLEKSRKIINSFYQYKDNEDKDDILEVENHEKIKRKRTRLLLIIMWGPSIIVGLLMILEKLYKFFK